MNKITKTIIICAASLIFALNISAIIAMAAVPGEVANPAPAGTCYQSLGYCSGKLTYQCKGETTALLCSKYKCYVNCLPSLPTED